MRFNLSASRSSDYSVIVRGTGADFCGAPTISAVKLCKKFGFHPSLNQAAASSIDEKTRSRSE